jgi:hypothetical protein
MVFPPVFEGSLAADLQALQETHIEENGNQLCDSQQGRGRMFQAVGMAMPPTIREI